MTIAFQPATATGRVTTRAVVTRMPAARRYVLPPPPVHPPVRRARVLGRIGLLALATSILLAAITGAGVVVLFLVASILGG